MVTSTTQEEQGPRAAGLVMAPIEQVGAVESVVRRLGEAIGTGALAPGEKLPPEKELAARLEVSVMTLRQALQTLREANYIETRRGRNGGNYICKDSESMLRAFSHNAELISSEEIRDFTDWRRAVSGEAAFLAAQRATEVELERLRQASKEVEQSFENFAAFRLADARLHLAIAEASHSESLVMAETSIQSRLGQVLQAIEGPPAADRESHKEHELLLKAIFDGDAERSRIVMNQHVEGTYDWYLGLLLGRLK